MRKKPVNLGKAIVLGAVVFAAIGIETQVGWRSVRQDVNPLALAVSFVAICTFFEDIRQIVINKPEAGHNRFVDVIVRGEGIILLLLGTYWVVTS